MQFFLRVMEFSGIMFRKCFSEVTLFKASGWLIGELRSLMWHGHSGSGVISRTICQSVWYIQKSGQEKSSVCSYGQCRQKNTFAVCVCVFVYCKRNRVNLKEGQRPKKEECMWKRERQSGERGRISLAAYKALRAHFRQKWILAVRNDDNTLIKHLKLRNLSVVFVGTL